jgi:hypothetical protein
MERIIAPSETIFSDGRDRFGRQFPRFRQEQKSEISTVEKGWPGPDRYGADASKR